jgi:hypothetical protein
VERLTETPFIVALISVIAAAFIVPAVKKWYFDVQNRLRVEMRMWRTNASNAVREAVRGEPKFPYGSPINRVINAESYVTLKITNTSKKKISGVSLIMPDSSGSYQIDESKELAEIAKGQAAIIGDIQPRHSRVVHIWLMADHSKLFFKSVKGIAHISADELDVVHWRYPMPTYLLTKHAGRAFPLLFLLVIVGMFVGPYTGFIK